MASNAISAQGTTFEVSTDGGTTWVDIGEISSFTGFDGQSNDIEVSNLASTAKEYRLGLQDFGQFTLELQFVRADAGQVVLDTLNASKAVAKFRMTLPDTEVATFDGLVKSFSIAGGTDQTLSGTCTIRQTGAPTWS